MIISTTTSRYNMLSMGLKMSSVVGVTGLMLMPAEPQFYVLCGVFITSLTGLAAQILRDRASERKTEHDREAEALRRDFEREQTLRYRRRLRTDMKSNSAKTEQLHVALVENTRLVEEGLAQGAANAVAVADNTRLVGEGISKTKSIARAAAGVHSAPDASVVTDDSANQRVQPLSRP